MFMDFRRFRIIISVFVCLSACRDGQSGSGEEQAAADRPLAPLTVALPGEFYDSLRNVMTAYYQLSTALVQADTMGADMAGAALKYHLDSLPLARTGLDSTGIEQLAGQTGNVAAEIDGMLREKTGLEGRRLAFQMVSDQLYDFLTVTGVKNTKVYRHYCPMAFENRGAYWLSGKVEIVNPYFGEAMLHCGSVTDTLRQAGP